MKMKVQPFLRWAGSKRKLLHHLSEYWSCENKRYIEPFAGSACLFFHLCPQKAILNDINTELIDTYVQIQKKLNEVLEYLHGYENTREKYYEIRELNAKKLHDAEKAARFIFLNRYCFNGLYRTNLKGKFNVPYGGIKSGSIPSDQAFLRISQLIRDVKFFSKDFETVVSMARDGDFVYLDPPYSVRNTRVFKEYNADIFSLPDLHRLRKSIEWLDSNNINFLLSYAESEESAFLQKDFFSKNVMVKRNIAGFTKSRKFSNEVLISNIAL